MSTEVAIIPAAKRDLVLSPVMDLDHARSRMKEFQEFVAHYLEPSTDFLGNLKLANLPTAPVVQRFQLDTQPLLDPATAMRNRSGVHLEMLGDKGGGTQPHKHVDECLVCYDRSMLVSPHIKNIFASHPCNLQT